MRVLFIHKFYSAQYKHILDWLLRSGGHQIVYITQANLTRPPKGLTAVRYAPNHVPDPNTSFAFTYALEEASANADMVARACKQLSDQGFEPDIIMGHIGWGELLFVKEVWPDVPVLGYFELFFSDSGTTAGFDPEFPHTPPRPGVTLMRNSINHLSHEVCDLGQTATHWQHQTFPESLRGKIQVMHEGVRTDICTPDPTAKAALSRDDASLTRDDEILTYVARNLEPVRGFHIFMRALPKIMAARPKARVLIVGGDNVLYSAPPNGFRTYREMMISEVKDSIDWSRVHFLGQIRYLSFVGVTQLSKAHIYLTMPFVPSWSMFEAMSAQAPLISSDVTPVREIVTDGETGHLIDFFDVDGLAAKTVEMLENPEAQTAMCKAARTHIVENYDFNTVILPRQLQMINSLLPKKLHLTA